MKSSENKRSIIVGIFIALGLLIFIAGIFTLGGQQNKFIRSMHLIAIFDDVEGLKEGNNVWFSGVKIGTVKKIDFIGSSRVKVTLNVSKDAQKYIRKNAKAKVSSEGFIGNKIVVIYGGDPQLPEVQDDDQLAVETSISTEDIMNTFQENNKNLLDITRDFKLLSLKIVRGKGTIGAVLTDSLMAENFRNIVSNLQIASENTAKVSASVSQLATNLNTKGGLAHELVNDTTVFHDLKTSVAQLRQIANNASQITEQLNQTSSHLGKTDNAVGLLLNDQQTAESLKKTVSNLESSTKKLDENMEALQHNFLLRGFFKKKAKEAAKTEGNN